MSRTKDSWLGWTLATVGLVGLGFAAGLHRLVWALFWVLAVLWCGFFLILSDVRGSGIPWYLIAAFGVPVGVGIVLRIVYGIVAAFFGGLSGLAGPQGETSSSTPGAQNAENNSAKEIREDHYETLEVSSSASAETIRAAYKSLVQRYHPDRNPGDVRAAERTQRINRAYEILSDPKPRADYDARRGNPNQEIRQKAHQSSAPMPTRTPQAAAKSSMPLFWLSVAMAIGAFIIIDARRDKATKYADDPIAARSIGQVDKTRRTQLAIDAPLLSVSPTQYEKPREATSDVQRNSEVDKMVMDSEFLSQEPQQQWKGINSLLALDPKFRSLPPKEQEKVRRRYAQELGLPAFITGYKLQGSGDQARPNSMPAPRVADKLAPPLQTSGRGGDLAPKAPSAGNATSADHLDAWRKLRRNMQRESVQALLGEPLRIQGGAFEDWYYSGRRIQGPYVRFYEGRLDSWQEP